MARNRIIYASQSVWCNGEVLYRVQSLGSTTTFTSEDIFELGHLDIIDVVDDLPAVAVTLNTNDFGDVRTFAALAQVKAAKIGMTETATDTNANLVVVSGTQLVETDTFLHGVSIADFAIVCGNLPGVSMWAPVQDECSLGTLDSNIDQTLFMDEVYINSLEFSYSTGANATENYGAETDQKMWLLNDGRFVNYDEEVLDGTDITNKYIILTLGAGTIVTLSNSNMGFLRKDENGAPAATWYDESTDTTTNIEIVAGVSEIADDFVYDSSNHRLYFPTAPTFAALDVVSVVYAADAYGTSAAGKYMNVLDTVDRPDMLGAVRQGQVEIFIVDPSNPGTYVDLLAWRLTACTISADLTREPLTELGHLEFDADTLDDIDLADLMAKENLVLVVKVYAQTDEEAGGSSTNRTLMTNSTLIGQSYFSDGVEGTYASAGEQEYPLKTVIVEHLKITDEAYSLDMGANATQTFGFRSTNDLFVVKGDVSVGNISGDFKVRRNA